MDIYCPVRGCGEPWDNDCLHEEVDARREAGKFDVQYSNVLADFQSRGCLALETAYGPMHHSTGNDSAHAEVASAMYDLLGDDIDGAAAMMEDFEYLGLI